MKLENYYSLISLCLAFVYLLLKITSDYQSYLLLTEATKEREALPDFVPVTFELAPVPLAFIPLVLSIMGFANNNHLKNTSLVTSMIIIIYAFIPVGILTAF